MQRKILFLGVLCSLLLGTSSVVYGSSNIHTGLDISEQNTKQVEKEVRVQLSLQAEVKDLTKKLTKAKSDLKGVQKNASKQKSDLKDIKKKYKNLEVDYKNLESSVKGDFYDSFITTEGNVSASLVAIAKSELDYVDLNLLKKLDSLGWSIVITDKDIAVDYYNDTSLGSIAGLTWYEKQGKRVCYVSAREGAITSATLHELGHAIEFENGNALSEDSNFMGMWTGERATLMEREPEIKDYDVHSPDEYFAEYFYRWCHDKDLQDSCQGTYSYLSQFIQAIEDGTNVESD